MGKRKPGGAVVPAGDGYDGLLAGVSGLIDQSRRATARVVNGVMAATYYELGRRIVEFEQGGKSKAGYGEEVIKRLAADLTAKYGRGYSRSNGS